MTLRALLLFALLLTVPVPAWGFSSITWDEAARNMLQSGRAADPRHDHGYRHKEITALALTGLGFSPEAIRLLSWANFMTDWEQYEHTLLRPPSALYRPGDHFDRNEGEVSAASFRRGLEALLEKRRAAVTLLEAGNAEAGLAMLGRALHGVQDFHAHSNVVDLAPEEQVVLRALLVSPEAEVPASIAERIRLTGTSRRVMADLEPTEDPEPGFSHDAYAKDDVRKNPEAMAPAAFAPGRTKYQVAVELAAEASRAFVLGVRREVGPVEWGGYRTGP